MPSSHSPNTFFFPTTGVAVEREAVLLAIDDVSLPLKRNLCYAISKPAVRAEPVLRPRRDDPNAIDSLAAHFYGTVLHEGGRYRMWYYTASRGRNPDWPPEVQAQNSALADEIYAGPIGYAESDDGIDWTRPNLGQVPFKGSRDNNGIWLPTLMTADAAVLRDDGDPAPERRYKLCYWYQDGHNYPNYPSFATAVSPDGLRWTPLNPRPTDLFLEHASFYRHDGFYIVNGQSGCGFTKSEGGGETGRQGVVMLSPDFEQWVQEWGESFLLPEPDDATARGLGKPYPQVHLGVGAASRGNVVVGLYGLWYDDPDFYRISCDFGLVVSNDGVAFREPVKGHVFLASSDSPATPVPGKAYPTVLCQANGILNVGDETRIYHGRWRNAPGDDYSAEVALATLPRDRWGALMLHPGKNEGAVWTAPITLPRAGCNVAVNADGAAGIRVEVADARFRPLPGYSGQDAGRVTAGDGLASPVVWQPSHPLAALGGETVRLRLRLQRGEGVAPRLYAIDLQETGVFE